MPNSITPIWEDTNWGSYSNYLDEYPVPILSEKIQEWDSSKAVSFWVKDLQIGGYYHPKSESLCIWDITKVNTPWNVTSNQLHGYVFPKSEDIYRLGAFAYTKNITSAQIPLSVTELGPYTFYNSDVESVKIAPDCYYYDFTFPNGCQIICWYIWQTNIESYAKPVFYLGEENIDSVFSQLLEGKVSATMSDHPSSQGGYAVTRSLIERNIGGYTLTKPDTSTYGLDKHIDMYFAGQIVRQPTYDVLPYNKYMMDYSQTNTSTPQESVTLQYRCTDYCTDVLIIYHTGTLTVPLGWTLFNSESFTVDSKTRYLSIYRKQSGNRDLGPQTYTVTVTQQKIGSTVTTNIADKGWQNRTPYDGDTRDGMSDSKTYWLMGYTMQEGTKFKLNFVPSNPTDIIYYYCSAFVNNTTTSGGVLISRWLTQNDDNEITMPSGYNSLDIIIRINDSRWTYGSDITQSSFSKMELITDEEYYGPLSAKVLSIYNPDLNAYGLNTLTLSQNSLISSMPATPLQKTGTRRLYIAASIDSVLPTVSTNLLTEPYASHLYNKWFDDNTGQVDNTEISNRVLCDLYIDIPENYTKYTVNISVNGTLGQFICYFYDANENFLSSQTVTSWTNGNSGTLRTVPQAKKLRILIRLSSNASINISDIDTFNLVFSEPTGDTPGTLNDILVTADNYTGLDLQSLLESRLSVFYDYQPNINVTPQLVYYNPLYVTNSTLLNVIDISDSG